MSDQKQLPFADDAAVKKLAPKPPGILPKNAQTLVVLGISVVMVLAIALSSGPSSRPASNAAPKQQPVIDPNAARIAEYRDRIEEQTRRLAEEQARLEQAREAFLAEPDPSTSAPPQQQFYSSPAPAQPAPVQIDERTRFKSQQEAAQQKRDYESLFASNVALSFRRNEAAATALPVAYPPAFDAQGLPQPTLPAGSPQQLAAQQIATQQLETPNSATAAGPPNASTLNRAPQTSSPSLQQADGNRYRLFEGTIIETVLTNRLTGSLAGPVNTMVTTDVYSRDRQHLLIPQGSRVLGEVAEVSSFGQQRLAVTFHRLIMPDGFSVDLDQFSGMNQIGETGLRDQVDHHYLQTFGVSIAIGAIAGLSQVNTRGGFDASGADLYRQGAASSMSQSALRILDRYLNVLPTFTIREGHRIKIYLAGDLLLPAYSAHQMPSDL
jgi:type IV secretion system protein VirB10